MSQFTRNIVATIVVVVVLALLGIGADKLAEKTGAPAQSSQKTVAPITYAGQEGKNVLELLKATHQVESIDSSYGVYVQSIDGVSSTENSVWLYYINNEAGVVAADKAVTQNGQSVEWRYESF